MINYVQKGVGVMGIFFPSVSRLHADRAFHTLVI